MNFIVGLAVGALGMWAYRSGKMQNLIGRAPAPVQATFGKASEDVHQVANTEQARGFVSQARDTAQEVATSTTSDLSGHSGPSSATE